MKHYILAASLALVGAPVWATDCKAIGDVAAHVMTERQKGTAMSDMMAWADGNQAKELLVRAAYEQTRMTYEQNQRVAVADFRNTLELMCYQGG